MEGAPKLRYGSMAVVFTVAGVFPYAATLGVDDWFWLGVGGFVRFSVLWLNLALVWWFVPLGDPDFVDGTQ